MAKCSAFLTLSVVRDGEPAPYVRLIYTVSDTKPSTPSGTAETVPDGWGLEVPVRADKKIVWVSSGVVSVINGEYQYAEWSEPSRYTADATALSPIVQWKWGASDVIPPDEEESTVSVGDEAVLEVNGQAVTLSTNSTDWSSTIPDQPSDKPYLWKREWIYASEGVDAGWVYYCVTGKQGVEGSYNALGYTINGSSITFCGMDTDGKPTLASFRATLGGDVVLFQRKTFTISTDSNGEFHDRYFLVAYWENTTVGALALCYLTPVTETDSDGVASYRMKWVSQDGEEIATKSIDGKAYDPYVLADIRMVSGSATIKSVTLTIPATLKSYESDYFMSIMSSTDSDMDNINTVAKALGIERVFEKVAALEAFVNQLFANYIKVYNSIYGGAFNKYGTNSTNGKGFYLGSNGQFKAIDANLINANVTGSFSSPVFRTVEKNEATSSNTITRVSPDANAFCIGRLHNQVVKYLKNLCNGEYKNLSCNINFSFLDRGFYYLTSDAFNSRGGSYVIEKGDSYTLTTIYHTFLLLNSYDNSPFFNYGIYSDGFAPIGSLISCTVNEKSFSDGTDITYYKISFDTELFEKIPITRTPFIGEIIATTVSHDALKVRSWEEEDIDFSSYTATSGYIYKSGDELCVEDDDNNLIFSGDLFTSFGMDITLPSEAGAEIMNIIPMSDGTYNIGNTTKKFSTAYINTVNSSTGYFTKLYVNGKEIT